MCHLLLLILCVTLLRYAERGREERGREREGWGRRKERERERGDIVAQPELKIIITINNNKY